VFPARVVVSGGVAGDPAESQPLAPQPDGTLALTWPINTLARLQVGEFDVPVGTQRDTDTVYDYTPTGLVFRPEITRLLLVAETGRVIVEGVGRDSIQAPTGNSVADNLQHGTRYLVELSAVAPAEPLPPERPRSVFGAVSDALNGTSQPQPERVTIPLSRNAAGAFEGEVMPGPYTVLVFAEESSTTQRQATRRLVYTGSVNVVAGQTVTAREKMVELAKQYGIVTQYTALVGVSDADLEIVGGSDSPKPRKRVVIPLQSSLSYGTGSLIVSGGLGIAKNVYYGGVQANRALLVSGGYSMSGNLSGGAKFTSLNCSAVPTFGASTLTTSTASYTSVPMSKKKSKRGIVSSIPRSMEIATPLAVTTGGTGLSAYSSGDVLVSPSPKTLDQVSNAELVALLTQQKYTGAFKLADVEDIAVISDDLRAFITDDPLTGELIATLVVLDLMIRKKITDLFKFAFEKARSFILANTPSGSKLLMLANELMSTDPIVA
jgi:hypothetical protein